MPNSRSGWGRALAAVPGALVAVVPSATCPACLGAYAGIVSAFGIGALFEKQYLLPLIAAFLVVGVAGAYFASRRHQRRGPVLVTVVGSLLVVAGRFAWSAPDLVYAGAVLLIIASVWNLWLRRSPAGTPLVQITTR